MKYRTFRREHIIGGIVVSYDFLVKKKILWWWRWVIENTGGPNGGTQRKAFETLKDAELWINSQNVEERITEVRYVRDKAKND